MRDMPMGCKALHVSARFVLHETPGLFLPCSFEFSLSTMLSFKFAVDLSSNNASKIGLVTVQCSQKYCCIKFYSIEDKEIRLET